MIVGDDSGTAFQPSRPTGAAPRFQTTAAFFRCIFCQVEATLADLIDFLSLPPPVLLLATGDFRFSSQQLAFSRQLFVGWFMQSTFSNFDAGA